MICHLSKWFISSVSDSQRKVPGLIQRHINHCRSCQDYVRFTQTLADKAVQDARSFIQETPDSLAAKIKLRSFQPLESGRKPRLKPLWIPIAAVSMAAILIFVFFLTNSSQAPPTPLRDDPFFLFGRDSIPGGRLQNLVSQIESPYETEWLSLKKSVKSASEHLTSRLKIEIGKNEE